MAYGFLTVTSFCRLRRNDKRRDAAHTRIKGGTRAARERQDAPWACARWNSRGARAGFAAEHRLSAYRALIIDSGSSTARRFRGRRRQHNGAAADVCAASAGNGGKTPKDIGRAAHRIFDGVAWYNIWYALDIKVYCMRNSVAAALAWRREKRRKRRLSQKQNGGISRK